MIPTTRFNVDAHDVVNLEIEPVRVLPYKATTFAGTRLIITRKDGSQITISLYSATREQLDRLKVDTVSAVLDEQFAQAAGRA